MNYGFMTRRLASRWESKAKDTLSQTSGMTSSWEVYPDGMRVLLKGEELARKHGDYAKLKTSVGIGPAFGSVISLESFRIEALKGKLPEKK